MNPFRKVLAACSLLALAMTAGCSSAPSPTTTGAASSEAFPVSIDHRLGTATVPAKPTRIVALGMPDADVLLAVGIDPVAVVMSDEWPWQLDKLDKSKTEIMGYSADGPNLEKIAALKPDLILATGLGGNDAYYDNLSKIAPTVADKKGVITTDWQVTARQIGEAIGEADKIEVAIADAKKVIADAKLEHAGASGATFAAGFIYEPGVVSTEISADLPQARLLADLGLKIEPSIATAKLDDSDESSQVGAGTIQMSIENLDLLNAADAVIIGVADTKTRDDFQNLGLVKNLEPVKAGHFIVLDRLAYTAGSFVTITSISYAVEALEPLLSSFDED